MDHFYCDGAPADGWVFARGAGKKSATPDEEKRVGGGVEGTLKAAIRCGWDATW